MRAPTTGLLLALSFAAFAGVGCAGHARPPVAAAPTASRSASVSSETGVASWYGREHHGKRTASGERFDMEARTAAHRTLPFGTRVRVTHLGNDRSVVVRINDRGPFRSARILDLSRGAAAELGMIAAGTARVRIEVIETVASSD